MSWIAWIVVGLIAGLIARRVVHDERSGCVYTIAVGVLGALIGGALMQWAGSDSDLDDFDLKTVLVAALGSILLLLVLQAINGRKSHRR